MSVPSPRIARLLGLALVAGAAAGAPCARASEVRTLRLDGPVLGADLVARRGSPYLLVARPEGLDALPWEALARGEVAPAGRFPRGEHRTLAWCVGELRQGEPSVLAVTDRGVVLAWDGEGEPRELMSDPEIRLPGGVYDVPFVRDLDRDGVADLVLPRFGGLSLWFGERGADGTTSWARGPIVRQRTDVSVDYPWGLDVPGRLSQNLSISGFAVDDQNGDGHPDLAFRDRDLVQFFWSDPAGGLPERPTFVLDLEEVRSGLPQGGSDVIDTQNLLRILESQVGHEAQDLDGDGAVDLMLRQGRKVSVYRGGPAGVDRSKAAQVLRSSGNLVVAFAHDDDGDGRSDLSMLRVDDISLGQALLWAVAGGTLELDLFTYRQEEPLRFARKPSRQRTLSVELPSIAGLIDTIERDRDLLVQGFLRMPVAGDFDGDGVADDVVEVREDRRVRVYLDVNAGRPFDDRRSRWKVVLDRFDREAKGSGRVSASLRELIDWAPLPGRELIAAIAGRSPNVAVEVPRPQDANGMTLESELPVMFALDVDGDGADDVVVAEGAGEALVLNVVRFAH